MLVVCTGTRTEIGKTWVGATVLSGLRRDGVSVSARKPVQSFDPAAIEPTDREVLAGATGEDIDAVCPAHRSYPVAHAPPMAASVLGLAQFGIADLVSEMRWNEPAASVRWVEGVGGVRSPLADDGDTVELCSRLEPDLVVLVADAALGTINDVTLSAGALAPHKVIVVLNRYDDADDLHRRNRAWLLERAELEVITDTAALIRACREGGDCTKVAGWPTSDTTGLSTKPRS